MELKGSRTEQNLREALVRNSITNLRNLYFAAKADAEGYKDVSAAFRSTADGEAGQAHGHLEYLEAVGDPVTGLPFGAKAENLKAAIAAEMHEYMDCIPGWRRALGKRALTILRTGSKPLLRRSVLTPTASRRRWTASTNNATGARARSTPEFSDDMVSDTGPEFLAKDLFKCLRFQPNCQIDVPEGLWPRLV